MYAGLVSGWAGHSVCRGQQLFVQDDLMSTIFWDGLPFRTVPMHILSVYQVAMWQEEATVSYAQGKEEQI